MSGHQALRLAIFALSAARIISAQEIVVRLINVNTGVGMKNCDVKLTLGDPSVRPPPPETRFLKTSSDGRARFSIAEPLPRLVWVYDDSYCAWPCGGSAVIPVDDITADWCYEQDGRQEHTGRALVPPEPEEVGRDHSEARRDRDLYSQALVA
jgi:hypothetical protein